MGAIRHVDLHSGSYLLPSDGDHIAKLPSLAVDLDTVVKELLEGGRVEYPVFDRDEAVNDKLHRLLLRALLRLRLRSPTPQS